MKVQKMIFAFGLVAASIQCLGAPSKGPAPKKSPITVSSSANATQTTAQALQLWTDNSSGINLFYYSTFDGTSWTTPTNNQVPLGSSSQIYQPFPAVYYTAGHQYIQIWADYNSGRAFLYYAAFDGTSWGPTGVSNQIPLGFSVSADNVLGIVNDPIAGTLLLVWQDFVSGGILFYATYDGTSWSVPTGSNQIPLGSSFSIYTPDAPLTFPN